jgi:hypothetical protein
MLERRRLLVKRVESREFRVICTEVPRQHGRVLGEEALDRVRDGAVAEAHRADVGDLAGAERRMLGLEVADGLPDLAVTLRSSESDGEAVESVGVGDHVDQDDPLARDHEGERDPQLAVWCDDQAGVAIDERWSREMGRRSRVEQCSARHLVSAAKLGGRIGRDRAPVGTANDLGIEQGMQVSLP